MATNRLLSRLGLKDQRQLLAACEKVDLCRGDVISVPRQRIRHVYFPLDCYLSLLLPIESGGYFDLGLVGNEGMVGVALTLGMSIETRQATVLGSGTALRMSAASYRHKLQHLPGMRKRLNRYVYVAHQQLTMRAACSQLHTLDLRLARQLLTTHDRAGSDSFHLTHKLLAQMLGVRRVGVTNSAGSLQRRRLLRYRRGEIRILNRARLEEASCTCYQASRDLYARVLD